VYLSYEAREVKAEEIAVARQRIGKHVPMAMNTCLKVELLAVVFNMQSVSYQILDM
jgi:hypothetical protein